MLINELEFKNMVEAAVFSALQKMPLQLAKVAAPEPATEKKYIYSIKQLAEFLNCSVVTAQKLKNQGRIPCKQIGRKLIFETDLILSAMSNNKVGKGFMK